MEKRKKFLFLLLFLGMVSYVHLALVTAPGDINNNLLENLEPSSEETILGYAWSKWSPWSPCTRTCGGGVSVQKRECSPRTKSNTTSYSVQQGPLLITLMERTSPHECLGPSQRFHECNTKPCFVGSDTDTRAAQCTAFDARPFRGKFYSWVPYIDGASPCTLNCRPLGQPFYASLGLVADGTPCTKPGFRAVCVHGACEEKFLNGDYGPANEASDVHPQGGLMIFKMTQEAAGYRPHTVDHDGIHYRYNPLDIPLLSMGLLIII